MKLARRDNSLVTGQDDYDFIRFHDGYTDCYHIDQGGQANWGHGNSTPALSLTQKNWFRVASHGQTLTVKIIPGQASAPTEAQWSAASVALSISNLDMTGGRIGFESGSYSNHFDDFTLKTDRDADGTYETTEAVENFTVDSNGYAPDDFTHDAAGNLTYDGVHQFTYDAWNRQVKVTKAYRVATDDGSGGVTLGNVQLGSVVSESQYDGLNRRVVKQVENSGNLDCTYHYYYKGQSIIEVRNGSDAVIKQYVWGGASGDYIDDLVQVAVNGDPVNDPGFNPSDPDHDFRGYWAMHDANYDVQGIIDDQGDLKERYTYTPYGQRQVFFSPGSNDLKDYAGTLMSRRVTLGTSGITAPYGLNPFGHQGLYHDEESRLIYNRARMYSPKLGRWLQRESLSYIDGMSAYQYVRSNPLFIADPTGLNSVGIAPPTMPKPPLTPSPVHPGPLWPEPIPPAPLPPPEPWFPPLPPLPEIPPELPPAAVLGGGMIVGGAAGTALAGALINHMSTFHNGPGYFPRCKTGCLPCRPPVGTRAYRLDRVPPSDPHFPFPGTHIHIYEMHQSPPRAGCICFWHKIGVIGGSTPPPGMPPMPPPGTNPGGGIGLIR